jgi:hypothetical protein
VYATCGGATLSGTVCGGVWGAPRVRVLGGGGGQATGAVEPERHRRRLHAKRE